MHFHFLCLCVFYLSLYLSDSEWWFVFLLWSTLCMFIIDRYFPPKKWHWTQHCLFIWWCCCFYLPQKSKFVMICILSTSRWITREWRLLCGPHFCCSCFLCKDTLCHRTSCCVYRSPSLFQSEQMVYCAICNLNFFLRLIFAECVWRQEMWSPGFRLFFYETVNVRSTANPGHIAQRLIGGDTLSPWGSALWIMTVALWCCGWFLMMQSKANFVYIL